MEEQREEWNPEDSSQPQLRIQHNLNWEEYTVQLFLRQCMSDSGGLRIVWGAYFDGAVLIKVSCRDCTPKRSRS